ncbi:MAG: hypothetical protein AB1490_16655 [Pseudomonadota bacterium]
MATLLRFWPRLVRAVFCIALAITLQSQGAGHLHSAKALDGIPQVTVVVTQPHSAADGCAGSSHSKAAVSDCAEHCCPLPSIGASATDAERLEAAPRTVAVALHDAHVALPDEPPRT